MQSRNGAAVFIKTALSLALLSVLPAAAHGQRAAAKAIVVAAPSRSDGLTRAMQDTIAAHIASLELQRPELLASGRSLDHPDVVATDRRLAALRAQLRQLPDPGNAEAAVNAEVMRAIEARLASLAVAERLRAVDVPASHPDLQAMVKLEAALKQRRNELQELKRQRA